LSHAIVARLSKCFRIKSCGKLFFCWIGVIWALILDKERDQFLK